MPNLLFNSLSGNNAPQNFNNFQQMLQQFQQFKACFQGNPKQEVERLLQSGRITQEQLNQLQSMANQLQQFMR